MGVAIPGGGFVEDRASGALVVDGSLRFDSGKSNYLTRTPASAGNRKTWTWSGWVKRGSLATGTDQVLFCGGETNSATGFLGIYYENNGIFTLGSSINILNSTPVYRDPGAWAHILLAFDSTAGTNSDKAKLYVNGTEVTTFNTDNRSTITNQDYGINQAARHEIGRQTLISARYFDGYLANVYFIDGQALTPSYFGYTDALTNTWRPKKLSSSVAFGTNGFYLPFDGSAPIGQDQSGRGNNWTPVNFGGSNTLEKATGALPILNTDGGGKVARVGVFGSQVGAYYAVTVPGGTGGGFYLDGVQEPTLSFIRGATYTFDQSAASNSGHPLLFSTTQDGTTYSDGVTTSGTPGSSGAFTKITVPHNSADTLYYKCGNHSGMGASISVTTDEKKSDLYAWKNVLALPLVGIKSDFSNAVNSGTSNKAITNTGSMTFPGGTGGFYDSAALCGSSKVLTTSSSADFNFGTGDFTIEYWLYRTSLGNNDSAITNFSQVGSGYLICLHAGTGYNDATLYLNASVAVQGGTPQANVWNHYAYVRSGTTCTIYKNGVAIASGTSSAQAGSTNVMNIGAYSDGSSNISGYMQDVRMYKGLAKYTQNFIPASTDPDILPDTPSGVSYTSNLTQITDGAVAFDGSGDYLSLASSSDFNFGTGDFTIECFIYSISSSDQRILHGSDPTYEFVATSSGLVFALSGTFSTTLGGIFTINKWNHITLVRSGSTVTGYINGVACPTTHDIASNSVSYNSNGTLIGRNHLSAGTPSFTTGFISNFHVVKGTALYTSNFTPPTGPISSVANTKLLCCKSNSSATAFDVSPGTITANGNAAATNFNPFTVNINTQRGKQSGWATWNPLEPTVGTLSNGNLLMVGSSAWKSTKGTVSVSSGKWYYEGVVQGNTFGTATGNLGGGIGWYTTKNPSYNVDASTSSLYANLLGFHNTGQYNNFSTIQTSTGSMTAGDVIGVALNKDSNTFAFYKNGVSIVSGSLANTTDDLTPWTNAYYSSDSTWVCNFGQKPFKFPPPAGFQPLALANTPRPTIVRPDQYVGVTTYTGTGAARSINTGFKPDLVWVKKRGSTSDRNIITDSVRGANLTLNSDDTRSEATATEAGQITAFNGNGFSLGTNSNVTGNGDTFVAWSWKAGGNSNTYNINDVGYATASAAGLTAGTITPTGASVNTKSGFSIIGYTGTGSAGSISHGLGKAPSFIIIKKRTSSPGATNWRVYHSGIGNTKALFLSTTGAEDTNSVYWNNTSPTSSVFTLGTDDGLNASSQTHIAYLWAEIPGFSKFGIYTGNASTDGPMIVTGFKPKLLIFKRTDTTLDWVIRDTERDKYNGTGYELYPNLSNSEGGPYTSPPIVDWLSNGFKLRSNTATASNGSGPIIYMAFAETPTQNLYGAQASAR